MSIRYWLLKKAQNIDDCIDYAKETELISVNLQLEVVEHNAYYFFLNEYVSHWKWNFKNETICYSKTYENHLSNISKERKKLIINKANLGLSKDIKRIDDHFHSIKKDIHKRF